MPSQISADADWLWLHTRPPAEQAVTPLAQTPSRPVWQATPPPGLPSSTAPLQSLSTPSQLSAEGDWVWLQTRAPAEQAVTPAEQAPGLPVWQPTPAPGLPLSTAPSQSLSTPSHSSADAAFVWLQISAP